MERITSLIGKHESLRGNAINLIVSENRMTDTARAVSNSDMYSRYAAEFYAGTDYIREVIDLVTASAKKVFGVKYANVAPISGNISFMSVVLAFSKAGQSIGRIPPFFPGGGYPFKLEEFERVPLDLPFSPSAWRIDVEAAREMLNRERPGLVILAPSIVTYPVPVREIADTVHGYGGVVAYDGSHVLGLIAGGQFQDPLNEGADLLFGSTHKTFPGPQGGIVLTNSEDIHEKVRNYANFTPLDGPRLMCNPHPARIAAMGIVLEETRWKEYAAAVVKNAQAIANTLNAEGIPLQGEDNDEFEEFTYCHQVLPKYPIEDAKKTRDRLAPERILVDGFVRMGTSEVTRLGYTEEDCSALAKIVAAFMKGEESKLKYRDTIAELVKVRHEVVL